MSQVHPSQQASGSASASNAAQGHGASKSDHAMYSAMIALLSGMGENETISDSIATISKTLYDTMVQNGTEQIQNLQNELDASNFTEENWTTLQNYLTQHQQWANQVQDLKNQIKNYPDSPGNPFSAGGILALEQQLLNLLQNEPQLPTLPPLPPGETISDILNTVSQYGSIDAYRSEQNAIAQEINVANTNVQNNKAIPDAMQAEVEQLTEAQGEFTAEVASFVALSRDQMMATGN